MACGVMRGNLWCLDSLYPWLTILVISEFHARSVLAKDETCPLFTSDVMSSFWS